MTLLEVPNPVSMVRKHGTPNSQSAEIACLTRAMPRGLLADQNSHTPALKLPVVNCTLSLYRDREGSFKCQH